MTATGPTAYEILSAPVFSYGLASFIGLCLGSFATALSHRLPLGQSIWRKTRSACPACDRNLEAIDLVPLFSWLLLRGRCRRCREPIGWRYPLIELSTVALCLSFLYLFGLTPALLALLALAPVIVSLVDIDFRHRIIPDGLNLSVAILGFTVVFLFYVGAPRGAEMATERLISGAAAAAAYGLGSFALRAAMQAILKKDPLGFGDIKLFAALGVWVGLSLENLAYLAMLCGGGSLLIGLFWRRLSKDPEYPFGPAIIFAFLCILFYRGADIFAI
jgi:prepilin signal peptidase PulO-like enzyme (type II secretory pathway)